MDIKDIIEDIKTKTNKYLGFVGSGQNRFDAITFTKIVQSVQDEFKVSNDETIREFFKNYYDFDIYTIDKKELEAKLKSYFQPYTTRDDKILLELEDIENYQLHVQIFKNEINKEYQRLNNSVFSFLRREKINRLKSYIDFLSMTDTELKNSSVRRARWCLDLIIGDFYIILLTFYYLMKISNEHSFVKTISLVLLNDIVSVIKDVKKYYPSDDRIFLEKFFLYEFEKIFDIKN